MDENEINERIDYIINHLCEDPNIEGECDLHGVVRMLSISPGNENSIVCRDCLAETIYAWCKDPRALGLNTANHLKEQS